MDFSNIIAQKVQDLKPSGIRKFFDIVAQSKDVVSLGVGEPDFDTPWHIRDEGIYSLEKGRTFYTSNSGLLELREEINNYLMRLKEWYGYHFPELNKIVDASLRNEIYNYCLENSIGTIIIGHNKEWKQESNIGKRKYSIYI